MKKLSVIVPAYNERQIIRLTTRYLKEVLDVSFKNDYEIIVVDDGSTDGTVHDIFYDKNIVSLWNKKNMGKGASIKKGCDFAIGEYVISYLDADLELNPSYIESFINQMELNKADVVIGSKLHKDSKICYTWIRWITCIGYYLFVKLLFRLPIKDTQTGIKIFRSEVLKGTIKEVVSDRFTFDIELLVRLHRKGYKIIECPVNMRHRRGNRIGTREIWRMFVETVKVWWRLR